jgi:tetratricopeptide (TPR) repeat protein
MAFAKGNEGGPQRRLSDLSGRHSGGKATAVRGIAITLGQGLKPTKTVCLQFQNMKKSVMVFALLCGVMACAIVYLHRQKAAPVSAPAVATSSNQISLQPENMAAPKAEPPRLISTSAEMAAQSPAVTSVAKKTVSDESTNSISKAVDALLSAKSGAQKHLLFQQLAQAGELDQVMTELQQREAKDPNDPEIPTTLGEALLNKVRAAIDANGGQDNEDIKIMALQADQDFNTALNIDPKNWEAQFVKAASMSYWPANPQMDNDVVQRLSNLIDQQETMPQQPEFAQTYVVLGDEYQKIGQPEKAAATWLLGAQAFPNDPTLQKKISGQ